MIERLKRWAHELRAQLLTLWFCRSHPDTPLPAKIAAALVAAYAFSPIDLIPDHVIAASRQKADLWIEEKKSQPRNYFAAAIVLIIWAALAYWAWIAFAGLPADRAPVF